MLYANMCLLLLLLEQIKMTSKICKILIHKSISVMLKGNIYIPAVHTIFQI